MTLPWGMFGENLTVEGLTEETVHIGDRFQIGSAEVMVTQPRLPCYKLGIKFGRDDILKRFLKSGLTGFYFAVISEGEVAYGDAITLVSRDEQQISVTAITQLYLQDKPDPEVLQRALKVEALPTGWRDYFLEQLAQTAS